MLSVFIKIINPRSEVKKESTLAVKRKFPLAESKHQKKKKQDTFEGKIYKIDYLQLGSVLEYHQGDIEKF